MYPRIHSELHVNHSARRYSLPASNFSIIPFSIYKLLEKLPLVTSFLLFFLFSVIILLGIFALWLLIIKRNTSYAIHENFVLLEITPAWDTKQSIYSTEQLFATIHTLGGFNSFFNTLLGRKKAYSFEIVSTKNEGIRYLIRVPLAEKTIVKNNIAAFLPDGVIREVEDYLSNDVVTIPAKDFESFEFCQVSHFAIPLAKKENLSEIDPIAYITNHMTGLTTSEFISLQLILSPVTNKSHRRITNNVENILELDAQKIAIPQELKRQSNRIQTGITLLDMTFTIFLFYYFDSRYFRQLSFYE